MKNQQNTQYDALLNQCRSEINAIDEQILNLLAKRMKIVEKVREIKQNNKEKFFVKSGREADMIKNLVSKSDSILPKSAIVGIWRKIITSSNMLEQSLCIVIHNPNKLAEYNYLVREYYSDFVPIINHDSVTNVVSEIEKNTAQIAVFAIPNHVSENNNEEKGENWWINLANNNAGLKVFARIPFVQHADDDKQSERTEDLVVLAIKEAEKSQSDNTLFCIEVSNDVHLSQIIESLKENHISAKILKSVNLKRVNDITFYLVEAKGFFDEKSKEIAAFTKSKIKPFVKVLGCYPTAIVA